MVFWRILNLGKIYQIHRLSSNITSKTYLNKSSKGTKPFKLSKNHPTNLKKFLSPFKSANTRIFNPLVMWQKLKQKKVCFIKIFL